MNSPEIIIVPVVFFSFVFLVKILADARIKRLLIQQGKIDENLKFLYQQPNAAGDPLSSVKWGMVLIGIGLAFLLGQLFPREVSDQGMVGLMFLFAGFGFLLYYRMASRKNEEEKQSQL